MQDKKRTLFGLVPCVQGRAMAGRWVLWGGVGRGSSKTPQVCEGGQPAGPTRARSLCSSELPRPGPEVALGLWRPLVLWPEGPGRKGAEMRQTEWVREGEEGAWGLFYSTAARVSGSG